MNVISGPEEADATDVSEAGNGGKAGVIDDEEYARIMSRLDELEKEELEEEEDTEEHGDDSHDTHDQDSNDLVSCQTVVLTFHIKERDVNLGFKQIHMSRTQESV